jgi:hypothetical protein
LPCHLPYPGSTDQTDLAYERGIRLLRECCVLGVEVGVAAKQQGPSGINMHYSAAELHKLIEAANQACGEFQHPAKSPALMLLKQKAARVVSITT